MRTRANVLVQTFVDVAASFPVRHGTMSWVARAAEGAFGVYAAVLAIVFVGRAFVDVEARPIHTLVSGRRGERKSPILSLLVVIKKKSMG